MPDFTKHWKELTWVPPVPEVTKVSDIYLSTTTIPDRYIVTGFRQVKSGDLFLSTDGVIVGAPMDSITGTPRLILERRKVRKVVFTEVRRGSVKPDEYVAWTDSLGTFQKRTTPLEHACSIAYTREDIEE